MIAHAAGESAQLPGAGEARPPTRVVVLSATVPRLLALARALTDAEVAFVFVREPDEPWCGAPMAIGLAPMPRVRARRLLARLPLLRGDERSELQKRVEAAPHTLGEER